VEAHRHAVDVLITAQEILVDNAGYPTEMIGKNSHDYRPLGLGYESRLLTAAGLPMIRRAATTPLGLPRSCA
jgi:ribonucleoside-diphosphate reductase alpha chain